MSGPDFLIDHEAYDTLPSPFSKALVADTDSVAALRRWFIALSDKAHELREFAAAYALAGIDAEHTAGKLAFVSMASKWVQWRLEEIGAPVPHPPADPRRLELTRKEKRIQLLRAQVKALGGDPDEGRAAA